MSIYELQKMMAEAADGKEFTEEELSAANERQKEARKKEREMIESNVEDDFRADLLRINNAAKEAMEESDMYWNQVREEKANEEEETPDMLHIIDEDVHEYIRICDIRKISCLEESIYIYYVRADGTTDDFIKKFASKAEAEKKVDALVKRVWNVIDL